MGAGALGAGGRAARALRLLLLVVMALAAVEYLCGSILDASPLRTYLYTPAGNATPAPSLQSKEKKLPRMGPKGVPTELSVSSSANPDRNSTLANNTSIITTNFTHSNTSVNATISNVNNTRQKLDDTSTPLLITKIMEGLKNLVTTENEVKDKKQETELPLCDEIPPDLGPIKVNTTEIDLKSIEKYYPEVGLGGHYFPPNCTARHRVAIIVPYRDRQQHLAIFLKHMHVFLMKQQLEYAIYIIEQEGTTPFNRAKLFNVGFLEAQRLRKGGWQCFVFHDVDLLPMDTRNIYSCPKQPRHMSASIDKYNYKLLYADLFGGVSALTREQFVKVNGFSNKYWGWGGEDDDMAARVKKLGYHIARYKMSIARYTMLDHQKASPNPKRYQLLSQTHKNYRNDGLSTVEYELVEVVQRHLYTQIIVNIAESS